MWLELVKISLDSRMDSCIASLAEESKRGQAGLYGIHSVEARTAGRYH
jgi:hypothetical protein